MTEKTGRQYGVASPIANDHLDVIAGMKGKETKGHRVVKVDRSPKEVSYKKRS